MKAKKSNSRNSKTLKFYDILLRCAMVFCAVFLVTMARNFLRSPFFSSGSGNVVNSLNESSKNSLIENSEKLNKLIEMVRDNESSGDSSRQERIYAEKSKIYRQEISKIYLKIADIVSSNLKDMYFSNYKVIPEAQEMVSGFKESAHKATEMGSILSRFQPQSIGFISLGNSELINAMSIEAKKELLSKASILNSLVKLDLASRKDSVNTSTGKYSSDLESSVITNRQKISELYKEISEIISNDLRNIQVNNPRITSSTRTVIQGLQESAIKSRENNFTITEFHPENIKYFEP